jgi:hypothetical protein
LDRFETSDIFRGAFFLCNGGVLSGIRVKAGGRRSALFEFTGEDLSRLEMEYRCGKALVNPVQFRDSLNDLRDRLFEILRGGGETSLMREERRDGREGEGSGNKAGH